MSTTAAEVDVISFSASPNPIASNPNQNTGPAVPRLEKTQLWLVETKMMDDSPMWTSHKYLYIYIYLCIIVYVNAGSFTTEVNKPGLILANALPLSWPGLTEKRGQDDMQYVITRWWFQTFFISPRTLGKISNLPSIFFRWAVQPPTG